MIQSVSIQVVLSSFQNTSPTKFLLGKYIFDDGYLSFGVRNKISKLKRVYNVLPTMMRGLARSGRGDSLRLSFAKIFI